MKNKTFTGYEDFCREFLPKDFEKWKKEFNETNIGLEDYLKQRPPIYFVEKL